MNTPETDELPLGYEQPDLLDRLLAFILGLCVTAGLGCFFQGLLHPGVWHTAAVAAGLQPPETLSPNLVTILHAVLFRTAGVAAGCSLMPLLGALAGGCAAFFLYLILRELLPTILSLRSESRRWTFVIERIVSVVGVLAFVCAEPVWRLFSACSHEAFLLVGTLAFLRYFLRLLHYGRFPTAYGCLLLLGILSVESPVGLAWAVFAFVATAVARRFAWRPDLRLLNPMLVELSKWRLTLFFVLGLFLTFLADAAFFVGDGGLFAQGHTYAEGLVAGVVDYGRSVARGSTLLGAFMILAFAVVPCVVALVAARRATDDDAFLPFKTGLLFSVLFLVSILPLSTLPLMRFWSWTARACVPSDYLLGVSAALLAVTFTLALAVFAFDVWCRDHRRIALQRFPELIEEGSFARQHFHWRWRKTITAVTLLILLALILPGRRDFAARHLSGIVRDALLATVDECEGVKGVVTDGALDSAVSVAAAARGRDLLPLSMMGGSKPYEKYLRVRAAVDEEEKATLNLGVPDALRNWAHDRPERLREMALQLGFEQWRGAREKRPLAGGLVARTPFPASVRTNGVARARALAARVLEAQEKGVYRRCEDRLVREMFLFVQWRLARMAAFRAEDLERLSESRQAHEDAALAEKLDACNPEYQRIRRAVNWIRSRDGEALTPREGLRIALERADFSLARRYATPILNAEPKNANANFGMGMSYFVEEKYAQAEKYLKAVLETKPSEPAVLNNLAICCFKTQRLEEALDYSKRALEKLPDAPAVRKTFDEIQKALDARP